jgi:hypothetical protein
MNRATRYALGLLVEEMGEALCHIGRALRFGLDTLGQDEKTERESLARELGDAQAAIEYAVKGGVVDPFRILGQQEAKITKLLDPRAVDNLGRRLAPSPEEFKAID